MSYRWLLGIPLLVSMIVWGWYRWGNLPGTYSVNQVIERLSPWPSTQPSPTPSPVVVTPCTLMSPDELSAVTISTYLPARLSSDISQENVVVQRCLWLASEEKLTPTITVSLVTAQQASPSAMTEYWTKYIAENQSNKRFKTTVVPGGVSAFADSWGTHVQTVKGIVTVQASMPDPKQNQATELSLLELILPRLLASGS